MNQIMRGARIALLAALLAVGALITAAPASASDDSGGPICMGYSFPPTMWICR